MTKVEEYFSNIENINIQGYNQYYTLGLDYDITNEKSIIIYINPVTDHKYYEVLYVRGGLTCSVHYAVFQSAYTFYLSIKKV
jgi:hypothetical protein